MRVITDPFTAASATVRIEFDEFDGFMFATRPNQMWPLSELRHGGGQMSLTVAVNGDLIDAENIPDEASAAEVGAFIEYALSEAWSRIGDLIDIEKRKHERLSA
ncbi:MAG TPA: hypothetical protein VN756_13290 [Solirubrobacterales bacterium]|nr:hypothetical protein [Solirubrobacterales bacterium]